MSESQSTMAERVTIKDLEWNWDACVALSRIHTPFMDQHKREEFCLNPQCSLGDGTLLNNDGSRLRD
ncbi:hypothetical protein KIPB_006496 [Kipferlia bialata]|uniref:Uncharacterized protein n=1 Tax=Kipferlia bialata TaxID=797122 RepID=A0A9K3GJA6_9EUKA|nr:hypothetical protein KIPB_006496 [Kipferlia bialata]|eukprot:g6496.t1